MLSSRWIAGNEPEGAEEEKEALKVKAPPIKVIMHFRVNEKFIGFCGSTSPSQVTRKGSTSGHVFSQMDWLFSVTGLETTVDCRLAGVILPEPMVYSGSVEEGEAGIES